MGTQERRSKLRPTQDPLAVLTTAASALLNNHREAFEETEYNLLSGALRAKHWSSLLVWCNSQATVPEDHTEYGPTPSYLVRRQFVAFIKKFAFTPEESGLDPEGAALKTFRESERRCLRMNLKLRSLLFRHRFTRGDVVVPGRYQLYRDLDEARKWIRKVLGAEPDMEQIYGSCDFGGGASLGVHGNATNIGRKFLARTWTCTPTSIMYGFDAMMANHHLRQLLCPVSIGHEHLVARETYLATYLAKLRVVQHNKIEFVPKTAKTHRVIATEPLVNGFLQKGVDKVMRGLMRTVGIDLKYGWQQNQHWAKLGSLENDDPFATLDLSAASDSISIALAKFLLPPKWFALLNAIRSPGYKSKFGSVRSEKFCSMGNGFCFPLETLIFAALARTSCQNVGSPVRFLVYGDDIIIRGSVCEDLISRLRSVGFRINVEKSFVSGPFRESCGADWVRGQEVTPVYMRKRITTDKQLVDFHNSLQSKCFGEAFRFPEVAAALRALVPPSRRYVELYLPRTKPFNTGFLVGQDEFMVSPHIRWVQDTHSWEAKGFRTSSVPDEFEHPLRNGVEYIAVLRGASSAAPLTLRRETKTRVEYYQRANDYQLMVASRMYLPQQAAA